MLARMTMAPFPGALQHHIISEAIPSPVWCCWGVPWQPPAALCTTATWQRTALLNCARHRDTGLVFYMLGAMMQQVNGWHGCTPGQFPLQIFNCVHCDNRSDIQGATAVTEGVYHYNVHGAHAAVASGQAQPSDFRFLCPVCRVGSWAAGDGVQVGRLVLHSSQPSTDPERRTQQWEGDVARNPAGHGR